MTDAAARTPLLTPERVQTWLGVALIVAATGPGLMFLGASDDPKAAETPLLRLVWLPVYAGALGLSLWRAPRLMRAWLPAALFALLVGWAYASQSWSIFPEVTHRRVIALALTTLLGVALGAVFDGRRLVVMLAWASVIFALGSIATALAFPRIGTMELDGGRDWRGLFPHKNSLAFQMATGMVAATCAAVLQPRRRRLWIGVVVLCLAVLLMSRGKTSLLAGVLGVGGALGIAALRRGPLVAVLAGWAGATAALAGACLALLAPGVLLKIIGKDPTLTGRTDIWASVLRRAAQAPWTGYGYGAFWEKGSTPARMVQKETHWLVPTAHNGWLDLLVQVGWIGVALFAAVLVLALVAGVARLARTDDAGFGVLYMGLFLILAFSESAIEAANTLPWALLAAVTVRALAPLASRTQAPRPTAARAQPAPPPIWRDAPVRGAG